MRLINILSLVALLTILSETATASTYQFHPSVQKPISLKSGIVKAITTKWQNANNLAVLEQAVEDYNAEDIVATASDAASDATPSIKSPSDAIT